MELIIDAVTSVQQLQDSFNAAYPFLQLYFIKLSQDERRATKKLIKATPEQKPSQLSSNFKPGVVSIKHDKTVADLLKDFRELGIMVQVYRKSGTLWVETSLTEDWTLIRQNTEALLIHQF